MDPTNLYQRHDKQVAYERALILANSLTDAELRASTMAAQNSILKAVRQEYPTLARHDANAIAAKALWTMRERRLAY